MKTLRIDKAGYIYPKDEKKMDQQAIDKNYGGVRRDYAQWVEVLDTTCNNDMNTHPFVNTLKKIQSGGVYPTVYGFGAFSKTDRATAQNIKKCVKMAAA